MIWAHDNFPILAPILLPLIIFYIIFAFSTWIAQPISNLFLRLHPVGKYALSADEILATNIIALLAIASLACIGIFFATQAEFYLIAGGYFGLLMIPTGGTFGLPAESKSRKYMALYSFVLAGIGAIWFFMPQAVELVWIFALGHFLFRLGRELFDEQRGKTVLKNFFLNFTPENETLRTVLVYECI